MAKTGQPYAVTYAGLDKVLAAFSEFDRQMGQGNGPNASGELRNQAGRIATSILPDVRSAIRASGAPQATKVSATARVKRDRIPIVRIGATQPKLSGFRGRKPNKPIHKGSVAWGVEKGGKGGHRPNGAGRAKGADFYPGAPPAGALASRAAKIMGAAIVEYRAAIVVVMRQAGMI